MKHTSKTEDGSTVTIEEKHRTINMHSVGRGLMVPLCVAAVVFSVGFFLYKAIARDFHSNDQSAYVSVQYAADGQVIRCYVTHHDWDVKIDGPHANIWLTNWKFYSEYAKQLGADPTKCIVWNWDGKDQ